MDYTQTDPPQIVSYFQLISLNESVHCQQLIEPPSNTLISLYKAIGLILGPVNAILNGVCVHIFKHPAWKQSAMSRILKGLSIIELCMGISLFLFAFLYAQNAHTADRSELMATSMSVNITPRSDWSSKVSVSKEEQEVRHKSRDHNFVLTITWFLSMTLFSRCLVAFQVARNWSVVLLAAYRYDRICRPIGTGTAFPKHRIPMILIAVISLSFIVALPRVFELGIVICDVSGLYAEDKVLLLGDPIYQIVYLGVVMFIVQSGGPIICVCVLSAFVIRLIAKRRKIHKMNEQKSARRLLSMQHSSRSRNSAVDSNRRLSNEPNSPNVVDSSSGHVETSLISKAENTNSEKIRQRSCSITNNGYQNDDNMNKPNSAQNSTSSGPPGALALVSPVDRPSPTGDKLIFALCITFFILETPAFFSKILNPYLETHYRELDLYLSVIANVLVYLDSTLNAFVYMASNPTFRKVAYEEFIKYRNRLTGTRPAHVQNVSIRISRAS
ncbi:hypothetical protein FBUS_02218 [Fasciolopsis buskii]|uniref:G-protein coupled receptors family 1 profile domain-containing protein n=1 Tax=Fasciolopsis buskii TaxID=27845 RepID=A0A8E0VEJ3_9TREM|nr:hypothetical protein FBUS_02218 [Fasciolopsis buski]